MRYVVHCDACDKARAVSELDRCPSCGARLGGGDVMMARREDRGAVGAVSAARMREAEELAQQRYDLGPDTLMWEAGYRVADVVRRQYGREDSIAVVTGPGNNGGDGLVAASRLAGWGYDVTVVPGTEELAGEAGRAFGLVERLEIPIVEEIPEARVCIDAVFGYGLDGDPRPPYDTLIGEMDDMEVIAVDVPSGFDVTTGESMDPHVDPDHTVMLGMPKQGLSVENAGRLWLADIGLPQAVYESVGVRMPFEESSLIVYEE